MIGSILLSLAAGACGASRPPAELVDARAAYAKAEASNASTLVPAELHVARESLDMAERKFKDDGGSGRTRDLAYVAQRKAQRAEVLGAAAAARGDARNSESERDQTQGKIIAQQQDKLQSAQSAMDAQQAALAAKQAELQNQKQMTEAERTARLAAEKKAQDAMDALAKSMAVKADTRGTVITLSGSVLFATNQAVILPGAQAQLNQVADALKTQAEHHFTIEGHTDNQGTDKVNADLSQRRASAVRDYLVVRGVSANAISVSGLGSTRPIADNKSPEGRAMNRRVEIVVGADTTAQN